jgi:3-dehydroquinate synthetase
VVGVLEKFGLPVARPGAASVDQLLKHMRSDKKVRASEIRFSLPRRVGEMHRDARGASTVPAPETLVREILAGRQ